jgi:RNA polymerase subunit RPABC4/transcription elongation factor Spt4
MGLISWIIGGLTISFLAAWFVGRLISSGNGNDEDEYIQVIPLERAVLCMNCEMIFNVEQRACPRCCSTTYMNIGLALGDEAIKSKITNMYDIKLESFLKKQPFCGLHTGEEAL